MKIINTGGGNVQSNSSCIADSGNYYCKKTTEEQKKQLNIFINSRISLGDFMLKKIIAIVLFISIPVFSQVSKPVPAEKILNTALAEAKADNKNVFVFYHASWCGWCRRLEKAITSDELKKIFENNFVITHIDVLERDEKVAELENPGGRATMKKYGGEKSGLPFYVFLDAKGNKIADSNVMPGNTNIGYPGAPEEINSFIGIIKKAAKNLSPENIESIKKYLTDNAPKPKS